MEQNVSQSESEILQIIWESGGSTTVAPLLEKLAAIGKPWKSNTVVTFLARLVEKGLLSVEKSGRNNIYNVVFSAKEFRERQMQSFLEKMYADDAKELVASLLRHEYLTAKDVEELAEIWKTGRDMT